MKKLLTLVFLFAISFATTQVHAQIVKAITPTKDSLSSTDTGYAVIAMTSEVKSIECGGTKSSGTVGGKIYLLGQTLDAATWVKIDSLTIANSAGLQYKLITAPEALIYSAYKFQYLSTGGVWYPKAWYLRRTSN